MVLLLAQVEARVTCSHCFLRLPRGLSRVHVIIRSTLMVSSLYRGCIDGVRQGPACRPLTASTPKIIPRPVPGSTIHPRVSSYLRRGQASSRSMCSFSSDVRTQSPRELLGV